MISEVKKGILMNYYKNSTAIIVSLLLLTIISHAKTISQTTLISKNKQPATLFLDKQTLYAVNGKNTIKIGSVGRDPFLAENGLISSISGKPTDIMLSHFNFGTSIEVYKQNNRGGIVLYRRFPLPKGQYVKTTAIAGDILYIAGRLGKHTLGLLDLRVAVPKLIPLKLSKKVKKKPFDDLLIDGKTLIAVDNVVMPKWFVIYDISKPSTPKPIRVASLWSGINEQVKKGAVGSNYMALFCESGHRGGVLSQ
jgi:hypothetical protein